MAMMGGGRRPDTDTMSEISGLLAVIGDPKATAKRIKQLQNAQEDHDKALKALKAKEDELRAKAKEQSDWGDAVSTQFHEQEQRAKELDEREHKLSKAEARLAARKAEADADLADRKAAFKREQADLLAKANADAAGLAEVGAAQAARHQEQNERDEVQAKNRAQLDKLQQQLVADAQALERKVAALKKAMED